MKTDTPTIDANAVLDALPAPGIRWIERRFPAGEASNTEAYSEVSVAVIGTPLVGWGEDVRDACRRLTKVVLDLEPWDQMDEALRERFDASAYVWLRAAAGTDNICWLLRT